MENRTGDRTEGNALMIREQAAALIPLSDVERMGNILIASKILGPETTMEQALALMLIAQAEGRHPASAAADYHIIKGRPSLKSGTILARFQAAGGTIEWHELSDVKAEATFSHPQGGSIKLTWDIPRAKLAGYFDRNPKYKTEPRVMLRARLISEGVRTVYPRVLSGMATREEMEDIIFSEPRQLTEPRQLAEPERVATEAPGKPIAAAKPAPARSTAAPKPAPKPAARKPAPAPQPEPEPIPEDAPPMAGPEEVDIF